MSEINIVPYIDVMLVLLVIFMITAPLLSQGVKVTLPSSPTKPLPSNIKEPVIVNIDRAGLFYINYGAKPNQAVSPQTLVNRIGALLQYRPDIPVLVGGDKDVAYGRVIEAMALLQSAGVPSVGMITRPAEK